MSKRKLDMTNVEIYTHISEGIHRVKVASCEDKTTQAGDDMITIAFECVKGDDKGTRVFDNFVLTDKALWKLKQLLTALNVKCDGKIVLDTDKLIGKQCDVDVFHEEYNGQLRARVNEYIKIKATEPEDDDDDEEEDEEPEEKPEKKTAPKKSKKPEPEPEEDEDDDDWDEDWEEDEEKPAPKKKAAAKPEKKAAKKKPEPKDEDDDDDDEDWEEA